MTKKVYLSLVSMLTTGMKVKPMTCTAYDVYDKMLSLLQPLDNHVEFFGLSNEGLKAFLTSYDYRSETFEKDASMFCMSVVSLFQNYVAPGKMLNDAQLILIAAITQYIKGTDICQEPCNKIIKEIISWSPEECGDNKEDVFEPMKTMITLLSNNTVGQKFLDAETMSRTNEVFSSASNLLGGDCIGRSSDSTSAVPEHHMRTPNEWGIDVDLFSEMNLCVINQEPLSYEKMTKMIDMLHIDTNCIDFENFVPSIYDILNVKFCLYFHGIFHTAMMHPDDDTTRGILEVVTENLLSSIKSFKNVGYVYLILVEIVLNCLNAMDNADTEKKGYAYYPTIRAMSLKKDLLHQLNYLPSVDKLGQMYDHVRKIQQSVMVALKNKLNSLGDDSQQSPVSESWATAQSNPSEAERVPTELLEELHSMLKSNVRKHIYELVDPEECK